MKPQLVHAAQTVLLRTKNASKIPLSDFITPLVPTYTQSPLLFNGHLQTCYSVVKWHDPFPIHYARKHFINPVDGGHFAVDCVLNPQPSHSDPTAEGSPDLPPRTRHMTDAESKRFDEGDKADTTPILIVLHGLTGGSHELYLRALIHPVIDSSVGFSACVINARGCAMSEITSQQLFNAKFTEDIRLLVKHFRRVYPNRPLFAVGFSLGANILTNYLGEEAEKCELSAAAVVSNPWNLELTNKNLERTWLGHYGYNRVLGSNLRNLYNKHKDRLVKDPRIREDADSRMVTAYDFDREITSKIFGYKTVGSYYRHASSIDRLLDVRIPLLVLHAKDDPIACDEAAPYDECEANPWTFMAATNGGGHIGWFELNGGRWFPKPIMAFFKKWVDEAVVGVELPDEVEGKEEEDDTVIVENGKTA